MNDRRLKPPMLRSVVRERLPNEKHPFPTPAELASILSHVRTHELLSESLAGTADRKFVEAWRSAVDFWVERIVSFASSSEPEKCWAGSCLIGVTCEECCSDRFCSSYTIWFQKLVENIQNPSVTHIVKVGCCASLVDLFTRLSCFPNLKKDGTLLARKVIQPVLQMLNEDAGETCWDVAANLLCTILSFFPSSIQQHYDNVEAVLTERVMAAKCNLITSKKLSRSLAMLPKVKGDGDSWYLVIQKILISINSILSDAFQGLEEEKKSSEIMKMIVPPGKDPPSLLGGQTMSGEASKPATRRLSEFLVPRVTALMYSCCIMLTNPYPFPVSIPVRPLLATVGRVLQVDGSFHGSSFPLTTSMHQELLCAELPALHLCSLDFLIAIIKCLRSQLLPHGANVVRLLTEYFQQTRMPSIRKKLYSIVEMLLISMGVGMSLYLAQELLKNAFADLTEDPELGSSAMASNMQSSVSVGEPLRQNYRKKRKHGSVIPIELPSGVDITLKACSKKSEVPLSVKIAALKALESLLTVGGSLRSVGWRSDVDCLVMTVATNVCDAGWANEHDPCLRADEPSYADFRLAALEALLASLLSPTRVRPPYLSQGLDLFRRGRQETGSKIAAFCSRALLSLEVLIHPRALPLEDDHPPPKTRSVDGKFNQIFAGKSFNNDTKTNLVTSFSKDDLEILDEVDEEPSTGWFDKPESRNLEDKLNETTKPLSSNATEDITRKSLAVNEHETTIDKEKTEESRPINEISFHNASHSEMDIVVPDRSDSPVQKLNTSRHGGGEYDGDTPNVSADVIKEDYTKRSADLYKGKDAMLSYDSDSVSLDSLPDIVDGDPDSE